MSNRAYYEKNTMLYAHPLTKGWYNYNTTKQRPIVCTSELNARHESAKIIFNTEAKTQVKAAGCYIQTIIKLWKVHLNCKCLYVNKITIV